MAPIRRPRNSFAQPINTFPLQKAGGKDPRGFISGNQAGDQWDIHQFSEAEAQLHEPLPQYSQVHSQKAPPEFSVQAVPTRITMVPFYTVLRAITTPALLIRKNPRRLALIICNESGDTLTFSFGPFILSDAGVPYGRPIGPVSQAEFLGSVVPIDDIYVMDLTAPPAGGRLVLAYEGIETLEANV
jgi:hypothetical protein